MNENLFPYVDSRQSIQCQTISLYLRLYCALFCLPVFGAPIHIEFLQIIMGDFDKYPQHILRYTTQSSESVSEDVD